MKQLLLLASCMLLMLSAQAQIAGVVYKDFNGNGVRQTAAPNNEPGVSGVIINAYNESNVLVNTTMSDSNGIYSLPYTVPVRLEFVIPSSNCVTPLYDNTGFSGDGNSVRFVTANNTTENYAILDPTEYASNKNPRVYVPVMRNGNPTGTGTGTPQQPFFYAYDWNTNSNTQLNLRTAPASQLGTLYGVAYSKQSGKIFTSAFVKRHVGLGPLGPGGIYMITDPSSGSSLTVSQFYDLDTTAYRPSAGSGAPAYGLGTSYNLTGDTLITYAGSVDPVSGAPAGLGVVGSNATDRGLPVGLGVDSYDPAAFDQVGKVGLGDLEISDDGKFLFVMNLYSRKLLRMELDDAFNPTSIINITEYTLPSVTATNGEFRPFALGFHRNKLFVGGVTSGENGGVNYVGANDGTAYTDLRAYVFEMDNPTASASFNTTPIMNFPLNFLKGYPISGANDTSSRKWKPWSNVTSRLIGGGEKVYGTPMFTDIDFTDRGDMLLDFRDRGGDQYGYQNYQNLRNTTVQATYDVSGDVLIAGRDCSTGGYTLESNGSYNSNGVTFSSAGAGTNEGPGGGEFFYLDIPPDNFHHECSQGACAVLPGASEGIFTLMDANSAFSGGTVQFSTEDGAATNRSNLYAGSSTTGSLGKANGLGDIEIAGEEPPLEIGNRVWADDGDGIQDPGEAGIQNVSIQLFCDTNNDGTADGPSLATATTDADGLWYFNATNVTDGDPFTSGNQAGPQPNKTYLVKVGSADWSGGVGIGDLANKELTTSNVGGAGQADVRDNDAVLVSGVPCVSVSLGDLGENNHSLDFGFRDPIIPICLGDKVWNDLDKDGVLNNGEVGVAGVTVNLVDSTTGETIAASLTDAYGNYKFCGLDPGTYKVTFTPPANYKFTNQNAGSNDSTDSDVDPINGMTGYYTLVSGDTNNTVDAGIYFEEPITATVGDYVWYDTDKDGTQDAGEQGVSGITVTLCDNAGNPVATTVTDGNGKYLFTDVAPGTYSVGFGKLPGLTFSPNNGAVSGATNSDANPSTGKTGTFTVVAGDNIRYVDAGLYSLPTTVGSLGDRVWYDINFDGIQDADELGVQGVTVTLFQADSTTVLATTITDAYGNYIFTDLPQGQYVVGFSNLPPSFQLTIPNTSDSVTNSDAIGTTSGMTGVINLGEGQHNMTYDAGIYNPTPANNYSLGDYVWDDLNKDGIQDPNERGVPGITVKLLNPTTSAVLATTSTNKDGRYLFTSLSSGNYCVQFCGLPEGYVFSPSGNGTAATGSDANPSTGKTAPVAVLGSNPHTRDIDAGINIGTTNLGLASLGDLVWYDMNNDGIQDPTEKGTPGVKVILLEEDGVTPIDSMLTDPLGNYLFTGLNAGSYVVCFTDLPAGFTISPKNADSQGLNGASNSDVNVGTQKTDVIPLATGEDNMNVDMGIAPPAGSASLGNCVWYDLNNDGLQTAGEPGVQGVTVKLYNNSGTVIGATSTDKDGKYAFVGLTPETYSVGFENLPEGYGFTSQDADANGINGVANSDADSATGLTTTVTLANNENNPNLDAGIVTTTVASVGDYVWYDADRDGIQDSTEEGVGGVLVTLCDNGNNPVASAITKPDGSYIFTNVIPGTYSIRFSDIPKNMIFTSQETNPTSNTGSNADPSTGKTPQFTVPPGTHNPTIDAGITTPAKAGLGNYTWLDANEDGLQGSDEPALAGVLVTLYASDGTTELAKTTTDGNGIYSFDCLTPATYIVGFDSLPTGYTPTQSTGSVNDSLNSDLGTGGKTSAVTLPINTYNPNLDAGIYIGTPLPVSDLQAYSAVIKERTTCDVKWFTLDEKNTELFEIERSIDGINFIKVTEWLASGNTTARTNYSILDDISGILDANIIFYRVKLVDLDKKTTISNVISVKIENKLGSDIKIYPIPFKDQIKVEMMSEGESDVQIMIVDASGKAISKKVYPISIGTNVITVNQLEALSEGIYFVKIRNLENNEEIIRKIVK